MKTTITKYITYVTTFKKYYYLLTILVKKDVKKKYKGSYLGILWSLINPLLHMIILSIVFSTLFNRTIENFPVYLLCGLLIFNFFSSSTTTSMKSIITSANLIKKVYVPKYIITVSKTISQFIFFVISLIDLALIMVVTKVDLTVNIIFFPIYVFLLFFFSCGISLFLATITVFLRDIEHLYSVLMILIMYASAIFYPTEIIPDKYQFILTFNPVHHFIEGFRNIVYYGLPLDLTNLMTCFIIATTSMIFGIWIFEKNQDKFILYL